MPGTIYSLPCAPHWRYTDARTDGAAPPPPLHPHLPGIWAAGQTLTAGPRAQARAPASTHSQRACGGLGGRMVRPKPAAGGRAPVMGWRVAQCAGDDPQPGKVALAGWPQR